MSKTLPSVWMRKCLLAKEQKNKVNTHILIISIIQMTWLLSVQFQFVPCSGFQLETNVFEVKKSNLIKAENHEIRGKHK